MAKTTITTTGITSTTTTTTTSTTTTNKKSRLAEFYAQQLADYKKTYERNRKSAKAPATTTTSTEAPAEATALQKMQAEHEKAVEIFCELEPEEMCELIMWAQNRHNKFPAYSTKELRDVVNADDVYKDGVTRICAPLGEEVVRKAIKLVDAKKLLDLSEYLKHVKVIVEEWGEV
jgi:ethanolamine ammonia-lyase large subunit